MSCDEWFVIIGFVTSQESICMWLLSRKTRAAMELFGARLVRGSGWVHSGVFDSEQKSGRGELDEWEAQAYHIGWDRATLDEVDAMAYDWYPR